MGVVAAVVTAALLVGVLSFGLAYVAVSTLIKDVLEPF